ncbi:MAG: hypothetical protein ACYCWW_20620 [Deltaproteobacteria bacterium]
MTTLLRIGAALAVALLACGKPAPPGDDGGQGCTVGCCQTLSDCDGGAGVAICAVGVCAAAGGPPASALVRAVLPQGFSSAPSATLDVWQLAAVRPDGPPLDCGQLANGLDAGSLALGDERSVNVVANQRAVPAQLPPGQQLLEFGLATAPSGPGRLLVLEGRLGSGDGGPLAALGCQPFDLASDGGTIVGVQVEAW